MFASSSFVEAATSAAPSLTISRACAGPPTQATRASPKRSRSSTVGAVPSGGVSPLASEMTEVRGAQAGLLQAADRGAEAVGRHAEEDVVRAPEPGVDALHAQLARELDARQVDEVLAILLQPPGLLAGARLQRRAQPAARQQHGDRGPERARADDDRAPGDGRGQRQAGALAAVGHRPRGYAEFQARPPRCERALSRP